jgi:hypothetical protein
LLKLTQILIAVLFLFNSCGYIFAYFQLESIFKQEAVYKINKGYLPQEVTVIDDPSAIEIPDDNEIIYQGMLYDIIKLENRNGKRIYYCLKDDKESTLNNLLNDYLENNSDKSSNSPIKNILSSLFSDILIPSSGSIVLHPVFTEYSGFELISYKLTYKKVFTPPPQAG